MLRNILSTLASALSELQVFPSCAPKKIITKNFILTKKNSFSAGGPCVVLCGIKHAKTGKEPFQKALRSILDYCGRKP